MLCLVFRFSIFVVFLCVFVISFHFISSFIMYLISFSVFLCICIVLMLEITNHILFYLCFFCICVEFLRILVYVESGFYVLSFGSFLVCICDFTFMLYLVVMRYFNQFPFIPCIFVVLMVEITNHILFDLFFLFYLLYVCIY